MTMQPGKPTTLWKDVIDYAGLYQVSNTGVVRSVDRYVRDKRCGKRYIKGYVLKAERNKVNGYFYVNLNKNGITTHRTVHRLVAQAFIPNPNDLPFVNHIDEDKSNNCATNLEWITNSDNLRHSDAWTKIVNNRRNYSGEGNPFYGKHHSEETKRKISNSLKNRRENDL